MNKKDYSIDCFKLKHLDLITMDELQLDTIMVDVFGYNNTWFNKLFLLRSRYLKVHSLILELGKLDFDKIGVDKDCSLKIPTNIDSLSFQSRLDVGNIKGSYSQKVVDTIAICTCETTHKVKYKKGSLFERYREHLLDRPLVEMVGVYNDILKKLNDSNTKWEKMFMQVSVMDKHYDEANGSMWLGRFNLLKTQKKIFVDFGEGLKTAFDLPYDLIQWNNLESASQSYVHELMSKSKEREMRMKRGN